MTSALIRKHSLFITAGAVLGFSAAVLMGQGAGRPATDGPPTAQARLAAAERVCQMLHDATDGAPHAHQGVEHAYLWSLRRMEAQREVDAGRDGGVAALEAHAKRMREYAVWAAEAQRKTEVFSRFEIACTEFYAAEAEDLLARARAK